MKARLLEILTICLILALNSPLLAEDIKIGFLVKLPEEQWFRDEWRYAQQCADTYGFELIKIGTPDADKQ
jgi:L-arabinose transport system substrate-binding protein